MPRIYLKIKRDCLKKGGSKKFCKTKAAKIYNSLRKKKHSLPKLTHKYK